MKEPRAGRITEGPHALLIPIFRHKFTIQCCVSEVHSMNSRLVTFKRSWVLDDTVHNTWNSMPRFPALNHRAIGYHSYYGKIVACSAQSRSEEHVLDSVNK